ncbi:MAG: 30S ribosomal protein S16 [Flavobacteriales bacterium]
MPTKIRLQRHGRKARPIFMIVVADSRAKRDGKFIEKLGQYNPNTNPASIELNFDSAVDWLLKGAQPTNTARDILSQQGVLMKKHLLAGVAKGAFNEEEADKRFDAWLDQKAKKNIAAQENILKLKKESEESKLKAEKAINEARALELAKANSELIEEAPEAEETATEEAETIEEAPAAEEAATSEEAPATEEAVTSEEAPAAEEDKKEEE